MLMTVQSGRPFIVTGASASGKTSLVRTAHEQAGYAVLPTHTTRPLRANEINGLDMTSISEEEFVSRFKDGGYLEPNLAFARLNATGVYYGTPQQWLTELSARNSVCAMPTSLTVARKIQAAAKVLWIHLECPPEVRRQRLIDRGLSLQEINARMIAGESVQVPSEAEHVLDTSTVSVNGILKYIQKELS